MKEKVFTGMYDDNGDPIYLGDRLISEWKYKVDVVVIDGDYFGKLVCEETHSCKDIPYALNNGEGYIKENF